MCNQLSNLTFNNFTAQISNPRDAVCLPAAQQNNILNNVDCFYSETKQKQGIIGKFWDKTKNILKFKTSSKNTEAVIEEYRKDIHNKEKEENAIIAMNKYAKSQHYAINVARNVSASAVAGGTCSFLNFITKTKNPKLKAVFAVASVALGALSGVAAKAIDAKSANRKYDKKEAGNDLKFGAAQALISTLATLSIPLMIGKKLKFIPNMLLKNTLKFAINTTSILSLANIGKTPKLMLLKYINPEKYQEITEQAKAELDKDKYKFYDPRLDA